MYMKDATVWLQYKGISGRMYMKDVTVWLQYKGISGRIKILTATKIYQNIVIKLDYKHRKEV